MARDSRIMFQRQKLEKEEGKVYNEPGVNGISFDARAILLTQKFRSRPR